jgi:adenosylcobalamin-dependent ribonucleoside-triphosphate reductase
MPDYLWLVRGGVGIYFLPTSSHILAIWERGFLGNQFIYFTSDVKNRRYYMLSTPFRFTDSDLLKYKNADPKWGQVGIVTYKRTYARPIYANGEIARREDWLETCVRVVEGSMNLGISIGDPTATPEWAHEALEYMYYMGVQPPGRGYWMMGTEYAEKRGGDALNNCWYVAVKPQSYEDMEMFKGTYLFSDPQEPMPSFPFVFMFDRAMLGGGVGFGISKKNMKHYDALTNRVNLSIVLREDHPDWERIRSSEEWERFNLDNFVHTNMADGYHTIQVTDDREGWGVSVRETIDAHWSYQGSIWDNGPVCLEVDLSDIREYGANIKGFGGTASGPLPLIAALVTVNSILNDRVGKRLRGVDALDIMNILGRCVVAGNVRRTALISIGDADDQEYTEAKNYTLVDPILEKDENGYPVWRKNRWDRLTQVPRDRDECVKKRYREIVSKLGPAAHPYQRIDAQAQAEEEIDHLFDMFWKQDNHRWASNNSVYTHETFKDHHFISAGIIANGEPGIGNEWLMKNFGRIKDGFQEAIDADAEGLNPCAEITLWNGEPCNLVEFVPYRARMFGFDFKRCLTIATQYVYRITFAKYMWPVTQRIIDLNRRIGVSLTGEQDYFLDKYDCYAVQGFEKDEYGQDDYAKPIFYQPIVDELDTWYGWVKEVNAEHALDLHSIPSIKLTTMKPSGTVAKLGGVSSGIHWHYAPYMIQRIRFHETDRNLKVMEMCGFPIEKAIKEPNTMVVAFPIKNPNADHPNFLSAGDVPLEVQFANQFLFAYYWADNAVSATLTFKYEETHKIEPLLKAYNNKIKSTSLLPYSGHGYVQAPWEPITKEKYEELMSVITAKPEDIYSILAIAGDDSILDSDCIGGQCPIR